MGKNCNKTEEEKKLENYYLEFLGSYQLIYKVYWIYYNNTQEVENKKPSDYLEKWLFFGLLHNFLTISQLASC